MSPASSPASAFLAGRYLLRERIGAGAAGEIWSAQDPRIGRRVAIKFLRIPDGLTGEQRAEWESRFLLEARAAGRLSHPGIVSIHDVGTASDGRPFIVMELVDGRSLDAIRQSATRPSAERVLEWVGQIADALDAAHRSGVIHRDVKPANILVGADGRARVADFGIARVAESELTRDGTFVGSPAFAAPEQLCGAKVDGRADLFALAAVFYLLTTGRRPFEGDDIPSVVYAVCHLEPDPPGLSAEIDAVILRALAKSPDERFATVIEFAHALRAAASPEAVPVDRAEARAGSIGSAAAVGMLRGARTAGRIAREAASSTSDWIERTVPRVSSSLARIEARRWWQIAGGAALVVVALLAARAVRDSREEPRGDVLDRLRAAVTSKTSRVSVLVEGTGGASVEVREGDRVLTRDGMSFRLPPGEHELTLSLTAPGTAGLHKTIDVDVEPRSEYELRIAAATWPWARLAADWDRVAE